MEQHDEFLELAALSTSGDLTEAEERKLHVHLAECPDCRQALEEFRAAVALGIPLLSTKLGGEPVEESEWRKASSPADREKRSFGITHRNAPQRTRANWSYVWVPFAACILLSIALAAYTYKAGRNRGSELLSSGSSTDAGAAVEAIEQQMSDTVHDRQVLKAQLAERDKVIGNLRRKIEQQSSALGQMKAAEANLEQSLQGDEAEKQQAAADESRLAEELDRAQASVEKMQAELGSAEQQRSRGAAEDASLQSEIVDLGGQLREREQTIGKQDEMLSHDRDIRDLMGARDLYIAEVYDVGRDGATQKPFGRVFYTKGKSLIFYAYDLDQQSGARNAGTYQAWGRRGAGTREAANLGIFFEDNAAKKRWVMKSDDVKSLAQIDAVFVTVEPSGGSSRPSGKPLLFAYLKIDPNHP